MKNAISFSSLFLVAPLFLSTLTAHANILSPFDIVLYDEKAPQNILVSVKTMQDGNEWITESNCDKDVWIGDSASEAQHCRAALPVLLAKNFPQLLEMVVQKIASVDPNTPLAPLPPSDVQAYIQGIKIQKDPANLSAIQSLAAFKLELKSANDMLAHLPDNPDYLDRRKTAETEIAKLGKINQEVITAQAQQIKMKQELNELSESMLSLIRHKKLKNPQQPFSASNPETDEPNSLGKSQMRGTLLKAALEQLSFTTTNSITFNNDLFKTDVDQGGLTLFKNGTIVIHICNSCNYPVVFSDGNMVYTFMSVAGGGIFGLSYETNGTTKYNYISSINDNFTRVVSVSAGPNGIRIIAVKPDGSLWQQTMSGTQFSMSNAWTLVQ